MHSHVPFFSEPLDRTEDEAAAGVRLPIGQEVQSLHTMETEGFLKEYGKLVTRGLTEMSRCQLPEQVVPAVPQATCI